MKRITLLLALAASALLAGVAAPVSAAPLSYYNQPFDTPNSAVNSLVTQLNSAMPATSYASTCTGTTTATCTGLRFTVSTTGLTTAASTLATAMTVTNTSVTAVSMIQCSTTVYAGTGIPIPVNIIPAAGTFTFQILNVAASGSLNATVPVNCLVYN